MVKQLEKRGIAFICARERVAEDSIGPKLKAEFGGVYIANEGLTAQTAQGLLDAGHADAVAFGKDYISNPDLPERIKAGAELTPWNMATFYSPGPEGYVDYPELETATA